MSVLKDAASIAGDATKIWTDVVRLKIQRETNAIKRTVLRLLVEILSLILAFVFLGVGIGLLLTGCRILLARAMGDGPGSLLLGVIVTAAALILAMGVAISARKK